MIYVAIPFAPLMFLVKINIPKIQNLPDNHTIKAYKRLLEIFTRPRRGCKNLGNTSGQIYWPFQADRKHKIPSELEKLQALLNPLQ